MVYRLAAWAVFGLHWVLSLWLFGGALVGLAYPRYVPIHLGLVGSVLLCQWACQWRCPLTDFEKAMLSRCAQEEVYEGAFLRHYVRKHFGWAIPPKRIAQALVAVFAWSFVLWAFDLFFGR